MRLPLFLSVAIALSVPSWSMDASAGGPFHFERIEPQGDSAPSRPKPKPSSKPKPPSKPKPLPDVIPYRGGPVLPGYVLQEHDNYLMDAGATTFAIAYGGLFIAAQVMNESCEEPEDQRGEGACAGPRALASWSLLPVVTPGMVGGFGLVNSVRGKGDVSTFFLSTVFAIDAIAQVTGIVMITVDALHPANDMVKIKRRQGSHAVSSWYASPVVLDARGSWGGVVGGRF